MKEDDRKQKLKAAKDEVTEWLRLVRVSDYQLHKADKRLSAYVREVAQNPGGHNLYEQLAVRRFLQMCGRYGLRTDKIKQFFTVYESLYFPGKRGLERFALTPVQAFQFASIYGFWAGGRRVVKEACLFVPRKFSKTTGTASIAVYDLLYGEANSEAYVGANSSDQAQKCFSVIRGALMKLDPNEKRYRVNEKVIKSMRKDRTALAQCLTANARTKDGLNASTVIMDEFSQARDNRLLTVLTTSMGVRDNPLTVIITTASDVFDGPFYSMLQGYKALLLGEYEDDSVFAHLFEPDVDDPEDSEDTWRKVHPHIGVTVSMDFYRREYQSARRNGSEAMLAFRTKLLNVYAEDERKSWISATMARKAMRQFGLHTLTGRPPVVVSIDLSESQDFSAVSFAFVDKARKEYYFHTKYFFPRGALPHHPNEQLYRKWAADGWLELNEGPTIDYDLIVEYILKIAQVANVVAVGYDPYKSHSTINKLGHARAGAWNIIKPVRQSLGNFTAAVEAFEHGIKNGHLFINDNPINAYCFGNAVLQTDTNGNFKPVWRVETDKIDGVITKVMCMRLIIDFEW